MAEKNKPAKTAGTAIRKRQKIQNSNKTMFIWVAVMSAVVGLCLVVAWFLFEQMLFRNNVIAEKNDTLSVLQKNNDIADELIANVRKHEADASLNSSKATEDQKALQVVLDALPSEANSLAFGASLQKRLTTGIPGLSVESISVTPVEEESVGSATPDVSEIDFVLVVEARDAGKLRELLYRLERSIRTIDIMSLRLERSSTRYIMTIEGRAYYLPPKTVEMKKETVRP